MKTRSSAFVLASLLFGLVGCAGSKPPPQSPAESKAEGEGADAGDADEAGGAGKTASLDGAGVTPGEEEPGKEESGAPKEASSKPKQPPRPKMNAKAKGAFEAGIKDFKSGDLQGAKSQYSQAVKADSSAYEAHYALGVVYERLGNDGAALNSYKRGLKVVPDHEPTVVAYAELLARQENYDAALSTIQKAQVAHGGPSAAFLAAKAEVKSMQGQSGEAQKLAQDALKLDPSYKPAMIALARDHYRARRIDLALYALTGILDGYGEGNPPRDKNNAEARLLRGVIYSERGLRGPAMEEMELALEQRPDLVDAHMVLATYMMEAGNAKGARKHLEQAVRYDNKNVAAHLQLGDAYRLLGKTEDARRELEWVLAADPNQGAAHYNLGLLYLLSKQVKGLSEMQTVDKAIEHLEAYKARAQRGGPDDVDDLITRAKTNKALLKAKQEEG